jgi:hypothetical protein
MFDFDQAIFDLGSEKTPNGSVLSKDMLTIGRATLTKNDAFSVSGDVELPFNGVQELTVNLSGDGNFLAILPDIAEIFGASSSSGHIDLHIGGQYETPDFAGSRVTVNDGTLAMTSVIDKIEDIRADVRVSTDDYALIIDDLRGTVRKKSFTISNAHDFDRRPDRYEPLRVGGDDLNLGVLILDSSEDGLPMSIPGLMENGETGWYAFRGREDGESFFITGPWERPQVRGKIMIRDANVMFPFDERAGAPNPVVANIMDNIDWDVSAVSVKDTRYVRQFNTGVYVNMEVNKDNSMLLFSGVLKDSSFTIAGKVETNRGEIEYLDLNFRVEKMGAEFPGDSYYPLVYGKAWTVVRDSTNVPEDVYLTLYTLDDTRQEVNTGRWDRINVRISSQYQGLDETEGDVMATLGYSSQNIDNQVRKAVGSSTDKFLFRPLIRPIEREIERKLSLDVVRFSYSITQNFIESSFANEQLRSSLEFLKSSRLMLGKYLTDDVYLLYQGQLQSGIDYRYLGKGVGLEHVFGLEYRLNPRLLLQLEYDYNTLMEIDKDDKKVWLRHSFPF